MAQEKTELDIELNSGKYLFKYCKFDVNALQIIINKTLYFSAPDKLNDPLDSQFDLKIKNPNNFKRETKDIIRQSTYNLSREIHELLRDANCELGNVNSQKNLFNEYFTYMQNFYSGICCFSTKINDQNLMWSHYANEGRGLCFAFDKEKLNHSLENNLEYGYRLLPDRKVNYNGVKTLEVEITEDGELLYTFEHLFSKTKHWSMEDEYRIILEKYKSRPLNPCPNRFNPLLKFEDECLSTIIMGQRLQQEHRDIIHKLQKEKVFKAELCEHKFDR